MPNKRSLNFEFVIEELRSSFGEDRIHVKAMFGSHAVYVDDKIIFILRKKEDNKTHRDNGIWIATSQDHNDSLTNEFKNLREIELFKNRGQKGFTGWLLLPEDHNRFEETALSICNLVRQRDPRIGKHPKKSSVSGASVKIKTTITKVVSGKKASRSAKARPKK